MGAVVVLTGAGASKPLDYPTTIEFFPSVSPVPQEFENIYIRVRSWLRFVEEHSVDVEDVLQLLAPAEEFLQTEPGRFLRVKLEDDWATRVSEFAQYIREGCFALYGRYPKRKDVRNLYLEVLDLCGWRQFALDLFTTNYDPVTDVLLDIAEGENLRGYDGFGSTNRWDAERYEMVGARNQDLSAPRLHELGLRRRPNHQ